MALRSIDLMIGDWVLCHGKPMQIMEIFSDVVNCEVWPYDYADLEPIPLTAEILEKNGWKDISDHTLKGCETFRLHLEQRSFDYTLTLKMRDYFRLDSYDDRVYTLCEVNFGFKYVHELQHALRLCGIDKEIIL